MKLHNPAGDRAAPEKRVARDQAPVTGAPSGSLGQLYGRHIRSLLPPNADWAAETAQSDCNSRRDAEAQLVNGIFSRSSIDTPTFAPWKAVPSLRSLKRVMNVS